MHHTDRQTANKNRETERPPGQKQFCRPGLNSENTNNTRGSSHAKPHSTAKTTHNHSSTVLTPLDRKYIEKKNPIKMYQENENVLKHNK